jgi:hypothetical protein
VKTCLSSVTRVLSLYTTRHNGALPSKWQRRVWTIVVPYVPLCWPSYDPDAISWANVRTLSGLSTTHSRSPSMFSTSSAVRRLFSASVFQMGYPMVIGNCRTSIRVQWLRSGGEGPGNPVRRDRNRMFNAANTRTIHKTPSATARTRRPDDARRLFSWVESERFIPDLMRNASTSSGGRGGLLRCG